MESHNVVVVHEANGGGAGCDVDADVAGGAIEYYLDDDDDGSDVYQDRRFRLSFVAD